MGVSHVGYSEAKEMTKSVNVLHLIADTQPPQSISCTAHWSEYARCQSIREVHRKAKCFPVFMGFLLKHITLY